MKSVGEVMSIGSNFQESFQKALCSMEEGLNGLNSLRNNGSFPLDDEIKSELTIPGPKRIFYVADAMRKGWDLNKIYSLTKIDYWFLDQIKELIDIEDELKETKISNLSKEYLILVQQNSLHQHATCILLMEAVVRATLPKIRKFLYLGVALIELAKELSLITVAFMHQWRCRKRDMNQ
jgi:carbamoyl-phosphate synthase large subunit